MSSTPTNPKKSTVKRTRGATKFSPQRRPRTRGCGARRSFNNGVLPTCSKVSDKLEALKNLIPAHHEGEMVKPDQLFQQTADYIVLLRTQLVILQKLIEFYGSSESDQNAVSQSSFAYFFFVMRKKKNEGPFQFSSSFYFLFCMVCLFESKVEEKRKLKFATFYRRDFSEQLNFFISFGIPLCTTQSCQILFCFCFYVEKPVQVASLRWDLGN